MLKVILLQKKNGIYIKEGEDAVVFRMHRKVKVGVYQTVFTKRVLRPCFASRRNERGLGISEEAALLSPWQWRFEVDRMQSRCASSVDRGPCQPARRKTLFIS